MKIQVFKEAKGNRLADAKLVFEESDGALAGTVLTGFAVMKTRDGEEFVSVPSRQYEKDGETRYYNLLRPADRDDTAGLDALKKAILDRYHAS